MNRFTNTSRLKHLSALFLIFILMFIGLLYNCAVKEGKYGNKINGLYYGRIHRMSSILFIAVKNIDSISQDTLINFLHCLEDEESKRGNETSLIKIYTKFLYIDQVTPKNLFITVIFKPDTSIRNEKRTMVLEYLNPKLKVEIDYNPSELECKVE
jgi:hypothetical protein